MKAGTLVRLSRTPISERRLDAKAYVIGSPVVRVQQNFDDGTIAVELPAVDGLVTLIVDPSQVEEVS